jgi:hypothetical protein
VGPEFSKFSLRIQNFVTAFRNPFDKLLLATLAQELVVSYFFDYLFRRHLSQIVGQLYGLELLLYFLAHGLGILLFFSDPLRCVRDQNVKYFL